MKLFIKNELLLISLLFFTVNLQSQENPFSGKVELSYSMSSGNVEKEMLYYGANLNKKWERYEILFQTIGNVNSLNETEFESSHVGDLTGVYNVSNYSGVYGRSFYQKNKYRGYNNQWVFGAGYLLHLLPNRKTTYFDTYMGPQLMLNDYTDNTSETIKLFKIGLNFGIPLLKGVRFLKEASYAMNFEKTDQYFFRNRSSLLFSALQFFDISLDYLILYESEPLEKVNKTDQTLMTRFIFKFPMKGRTDDEEVTKPIY